MNAVYSEHSDPAAKFFSYILDTNDQKTTSQKAITINFDIHCLLI